MRLLIYSRHYNLPLRNVKIACAYPLYKQMLFLSALKVTFLKFKG